MLKDWLPELPEMPKKVLATYYCENVELCDIAIAIGLTEYEVDQVRGMGVIQAALATELALAEFDHRRAFTPATDLRDFRAVYEAAEIPHRPLSTSSF